MLVSRLDGHMALANSLALKLAGITRDTPDPQGGEIVKDKKTGEPTGILRDNAMRPGRRGHPADVPRPARSRPSAPPCATPRNWA